jgi:hypothetical protein
MAKLTLEEMWERMLMGRPRLDLRGRDQTVDAWVATAANSAAGFESRY